MIALLLLMIFLIVAGACWFHGLWGNALNLINVLLAGFIGKASPPRAIGEPYIK